MWQHTKRQGELFEMHCFAMFSPPFVTFLVKVPLKFHLIDALAFARLNYENTKDKFSIPIGSSDCG